MLGWIIDNIEWLFSGVGIVIVTAGVRWLLPKRNKETPINSQAVSVKIQNTVGVGAVPVGDGGTKAAVAASLKGVTHILFIDDDQKFKVVDILKKSGWIYTRRTSDIGSLDDPVIQQAHILFVDVQGVGRRLDFKDEGLGLAKAIKDKYPVKKVVIYSAQTQGERFHDALRKADDFLAKNADPYEFQLLTERLAAEVERGV